MSYNASEPEAQDLGFTLPKGTDLIREGDNAITTNALVTTGALRAAFNRLRTLEDAPAPVADHGSLTGLGDDDHPQYLTNARGDGRYSPLGHTHPPTAWAEVTDKPTAFPPSAHVHTPAEVGSVPADDPRLRDTGLRNITGLLINGWTPVATGRWTIQRSGHVVSLGGYLDGTAATSDDVMTMPTGFYGYDTTGPWVQFGGTGKTGVGIVQKNSTVTLQGAKGTPRLFVSFTVNTNDPWPTTLPGTPA